MCNDYGNYVDYADYLAGFSQTRIPVTWPDAIPNLQPRGDIWPTDRAPVISFSSVPGRNDEIHLPTAAS
jgi:hypothetical protein